MELFPSLAFIFAAGSLPFQSTGDMLILFFKNSFPLRQCFTVLIISFPNLVASLCRLNTLNYILGSMCNFIYLVAIKDLARVPDNIIIP